MGLAACNKSLFVRSFVRSFAVGCVIEVLIKIIE